MSQLKEYTHEEAFGHLTNGMSLANQILDERDQAMKLVDEVLERLTMLNTLMVRNCPIQGQTYHHLVSDLVDSIDLSPKLEPQLG